jgi:hypothetical protein
VPNCRKSVGPSARLEFDPSTTFLSPFLEGKGLFRLVKQGCFGLDEMRKLIGINAAEQAELERLFGRLVATRSASYRRQVLSVFESFIARESHHAQKKEKGRQAA